MTRAALLARFTGGGEGIQGTVVTVFGGAPPARAVVGDSDRAAGAGDPQTCTPRALAHRSGSSPWWAVPAAGR